MKNEIKTNADPQGIEEFLEGILIDPELFAELFRLSYCLLHEDGIKAYNSPAAKERGELGKRIALSLLSSARIRRLAAVTVVRCNNTAGEHLVNVQTKKTINGISKNTVFKINENETSFDVLKRTKENEREMMKNVSLNVCKDVKKSFEKNEKKSHFYKHSEKINAM